jgi:hypothetical protein
VYEDVSSRRWRVLFFHCLFKPFKTLDVFSYFLKIRFLNIRTDGPRGRRFVYRGRARARERERERERRARAHTHTHTHRPHVCVCVCVCKSQLCSLSFRAYIAYVLKYALTTACTKSLRPQAYVEHVLEYSLNTH